MRSRVCLRGHEVVEGTSTAYLRSEGRLACAVCARAYQAQRRAAANPGAAVRRTYGAFEGPKWNPWAGQLPCPQCGSSDWTLPYHPSDPRWRCVDCHIWITRAVLTDLLADQAGSR